MEVLFGSSQLPSVLRDMRSFVAFVRACLSSSGYESSMDADEAEKATHSSAGIASSVYSIDDRKDWKALLSD
jgi:Sec-independent protein translocase protein TatA